MAHLQRLDHWLASLEKSLVVLLLSSLLGLGLLQVILRNVLARGLFWGEEFLQHVVLWLGFLGASLATREQRHLRIDLLSHVLPPAWQRYLSLVTNLAALLVCGLLTQASWTFVHMERAAGTRLPFGVATWMAQSIVPFGFLTMAWRFALRLLLILQQLRQPEAGS
jgi:TRAP-type C4-dicarboxylate transport system permease small subunit